VSAVLVARGEEAVAIGLDVERVGRIDAGLWPSVFTAAEMLELRGVAAPERALAATLRFSAKEAIQKAVYAATGAWNELARLHVRVDPARRTFAVPGRPDWVGAYLVVGPRLASWVLARPYAAARASSSSSRAYEASIPSTIPVASTMSRSSFDG
jgi:4'-phosphopantetheinyl transferase EntD